MHVNMTNGLQNGLRSKKSLQGIKHTNPRSADQDKKMHYKNVHKTNFFLSYVPTKAKNTTTVLVMHSKEGPACGIVVSDTQAMNLVALVRGRHEKLPEMQHRKLHPHGCSYQTEGCTIH